jgi:hypothetical protein
MTYDARVAGMQRVAVVLLALACGVGEARADDERTVDDEIVAWMIDGPATAREGFEAAVRMRGPSGRAALDLARDDLDAQRAWLAEAHATRVAVGDSPLPELRRAYERATRILHVVAGVAESENDLPWRKEANLRSRVEHALAILEEGDVRALPWVTHFADRRDVDGSQRYACVQALLRRKLPGAIGRLERIVDESPVRPPEDVIPLLGSLRDVAAVPVLLRIRSDVIHVGVWGELAMAQAQLDVLRTLPRFRETYEASLAFVRRYEAEEEPLLHSTGRRADGGWRAQPGDGVQHMVYGPYVADLPFQEWIARFRWRIDVIAERTPEPLIALEVTSEGYPVQSVPVHPIDVTPGEWQETDIAFRPNPAPARMEFRVLWNGRCDATVDRIDLLEVGPRDDADRAKDPPRRDAPWRPRAEPRSPEVLRAVFDAAFELAAQERYPSEPVRRPHPVLPAPGPWVQLRDVLLEQPGASSMLAATALEWDDRAWLAEAWLARVAHPDAWREQSAAVRERLEGLLRWYQGADRRPYEDDFAAGRIALAIEGLVPRGHPSAYRWRLAADAPVGHLPGLPGDADRPLPASGLWRWIFAEQWLTEPRGPLPAIRQPPRRMPDSLREAFGIREPPPAPAPEAPNSTVGPIRLHALLQLASLGERRALAPLRAIRDDPSATDAERSAAALALSTYVR